MVSHQKSTDKSHLQKYIHLIMLFTTNQMSAKEFEVKFLQTRREDLYWLSNSFEENTGKVLDTFFLDISDYAPDELFDSDDPNNISEKELRRRAEDVLKKLVDMVEDQK